MPLEKSSRVVHSVVTTVVGRTRVFKGLRSRLYVTCVADSRAQDVASSRPSFAFTAPFERESARDEQHRAFPVWRAVSSARSCVEYLRISLLSWVYPRSTKTIYILNQMYDFLVFRALWRLSNVRYPVFYSSSPLTLYDSSRALPPPAHHSSARPLLASHAAHPLPAHMQPTAVYGLTPLSPAKHQYQPSGLWFTE